MFSNGDITRTIADLEAAQLAETARNNAPLLAAGSYKAPINPYYTRPQQTDALAPMAMLNQYRQTGQMPVQQSSFTPYTAPQQPSYTAPQATAPQTATAQAVSKQITGGK